MGKVEAEGVFLFCFLRQGTTGPVLNPLGAPDASAFDSSTLAQMGGMHINQVIDVAEMVTGCEAKNRYTCHMWSPGQVRRKTSPF